MRSRTICSARSTGHRATPCRSDSRDDARNRHADQVHRLRAGDGAADRVPVHGLRPDENRLHERIFGSLQRCVAAEAGDSVRIAGIRVGTVGDVSLQAGPQGARRVRHRPQHQADHRNPGCDQVSQPRRRPLHGTRRLSCGIDEDPARGLADTGGPHGARTGSRSAARWPETRYPGPESTGRQRADGLAGPDTAGPGRHAGVVVLEDVVVHELARRQQPGHRAVDRRSANHAGHAVEGRRRVLRRDRQAGESRRRAVGRPRPDRHGHRVAQQRDDVAGGPARPGATRRWTARSTSSTDSRRFSTTTRTASTRRCSRLPGIYKKLARVGAYGAFFPYYICAVTFRASDLQGRTVVFPWVKQEAGRCREE